MSGRPRSTFRSRLRRGDQRAFTPVEPVLVEEPSNEPGEQEKPPTEKPPTESQDTAPDQEKDVEGAPAAQGPALEASQEQLAYPKTGFERGDGPDVKVKSLPDPEPIPPPEEEEEKPGV